MLIEDIQREPTIKEIAFRIQQQCSSNGSINNLRNFCDGNVLWLKTTKQITKPDYVVGKVETKNLPKSCRTPNVIFNEIDRSTKQQHDKMVMNNLHVTTDEQEFVVIVPDNFKSFSCNECIVRTLYKRNIELITRIIDKLSQNHNRMKVASIVSKIDIFGSTDDRIAWSKDLTQVMVGIKQICPDDADTIIKHYVKPLERSINSLVERLTENNEYNKFMYVDAPEVIVIDSKKVDIDDLRDELKNRI